MNTANAEAERAVLGAALQAAYVIDEIAELITPDDFSQPRHAEIWEAICDIHASRGTPDPILVGERVTDRSIDAGYLIGLTALEAIPHPAQGPYYAELVRDAAIARRVAHAATLIQRRVAEATEADSIGEDARRLIDQALAGTQVTDTGVSVSKLLEEALDGLEQGHDPGLSTGWPDLDDPVNGLRPGQLVVIGARPSVGKSVIAANVAAAACRAGVSVHFASLEMPRDELMYRMLAARATVELTRLLNKSVTDADWNKISPYVAEINQWPLWIDDQSGQTLAQLKARAKRTQRRQGLGLVVVDYLQLMAPRDRRVPREQQVGELSEGLKGMAKELGVPVIALAQVNRGSAGREDKRPVMSDLRESGRIEADADHVWLLHREDLVSKTTTGEIEIIIAKNRNGINGRTVNLSFQGHYSRAVQMAPDYRQIA